MGNTDNGDAADRLRTLEGRIWRFPTGSVNKLPRSGGPTHPEAPLDLDIIDHITASVREAQDHVSANRTENAGPMPANVADVYDWWRASTPSLDAERTLAREAVIYRQGLEHAIQAGDTKVVRKHPCPECGCWGLFWRRPEKRAVCANRDCRDEDGLARMWELKHLAHEHVTRQKMLKATAT
ncbi:hypothetical protein [Streptomyces sp. NPDC060366]|uniref:hypothetical protein n=1 Tax=Streptomyces sp. NPDC060366 TaxID=3347105 RepID=UPI0036661568